MICLGIESTAHTFSCAIINDKEILADVRKIYRPKKGSGIHPREASRHHINHATNVLSQCFKQSGLTVKDLDLISYAAGPGLGPCLRVGAVVARSLSIHHNIPIYPINHAIGHIELGKMLTGAKDPLILLVSGGHTMILAFVMNHWRIFGETLDITLGQLLDQFGRSLGFASPCGPQIEQLAQKSSTYIPLPYTIHGNDVSFSGLLSATKKITPQGREAACFSLQETAFAMICEVVERAIALTAKKEILIVGGVVANKRLVEMFGIISKRYKCKFYAAPPQYAGDCGSQIACTALQQAKNDKGSRIQDTFVRQSWRLDTVKISY